MINFWIRYPNIKPLNNIFSNVITELLWGSGTNSMMTCPVIMTGLLNLRKED